MERREYEQVRKARQRKLKKAEANQGDKRLRRLEKYGKEHWWSNGAKAN